MADGSIGVLYTDRTILYNADGSERVTYSYASMPSVRAALGDSFVCMVYNTTVIGNDKTITISDLDGQMIFDYQLSGELIRIIPHGELLCLLFEDRAILLDPFKNTILETPLEPNAIDIVFAENTPIVCYSGNAVALSFYDGSETIGEN